MSHYFLDRRYLIEDMFMIFNVIAYVLSDINLEWPKFDTSWSFKCIFYKGSSMPSWSIYCHAYTIFNEILLLLNDGRVQLGPPQIKSGYIGP